MILIITGISEEAVSIQIAAPPVDGEANIAIVKYFSTILNLKKADVSLRVRHGLDEWFLIAWMLNDELHFLIICSSLGRKIQTENGYSGFFDWSIDRKNLGNVKKSSRIIICT